MTRPTAFLRLALAALAAGLAVPATHAQAPEALRVADAADAVRLRLDVRGGLAVAGVINDRTPDASTTPATGGGTRLMWWPEKAAFRAGSVRGAQWDAANVGLYSVALGYETVASGIRSTAMGQGTTASGFGSTAMGSAASTNGQTGAFVVSDNSESDLLSATVPNQFSARFVGGYRLFTDSRMTVGAQLTAGGTSWSTLSDSTRKERFRPYGPAAVLDGLARLRLGTWNYRGQDPATQRHWGPMAQDFYREFGRDGVGTVGSDTLIATGDADGVLFAAAQALDARTRDLDARIVALEAERRRERTGALAAVGLFGLGFLGFAVRRRPSAL